METAVLSTAKLESVTKTLWKQGIKRLDFLLPNKRVK